MASIEFGPRGGNRPAAGVREALSKLVRSAATWAQAPALRIRAERLRSETWRVVERIEACASDPAPRRARRQLAAFERQLAAHLAREEGRGHLAVALEVAPRYRNRAARLRSEHADLVLEMRRIRTLALEAGASADAWADVHQACDAFVERLVAHEEAENEIMARAFLDDLGCGD